LTLTLRHGLQKLIKIREVIQMGEDVEKGWHEKFLSEADLKKFEEIGKPGPLYGICIGAIIMTLVLVIAAVLSPRG